MKYIKTFEAQRKEIPFIQSAKRGSNTAVIKFIKDGVDINTRSKIDGAERTALMYSALNSFISVVNTLIKAGANVNLQDKEGDTALMFAQTGKIIDALLDAGADVNIQDNDGNTVIMRNFNYFVNRRDLLINNLEKFLANGLNLDIRNNEDQNFYDLIKYQQEKNSHDEWHQIFLQNLNKLENYMNERFPQYKEEWELKQDVNKYNL